MAHTQPKFRPRDFRAFARPSGDLANGVSGAVVEVQERDAHCLVRVRLLTEAEAVQLHAELGQALRALALGRALAGGDSAEGWSGPVAYRGPYPIRGKTLADVGAAE
jgi:hypothetical protein